MRLCRMYDAALRALFGSRLIDPVQEEDQERAVIRQKQLAPSPVAPVKLRAQSAVPAAIFLRLPHLQFGPVYCDIAKHDAVLFSSVSGRSSGTSDM